MTRWMTFPQRGEELMGRKHQKAVMVPGFTRSGKVMEELEVLEFSEPDPQPESKKHRRKSKAANPTEAKPKRKRGRLRKNESQASGLL